MGFLAVVLIILLIYYLFWDKREDFDGINCGDHVGSCHANWPMGRGSLGVRNPFIYPYSASECVSDADTAMFLAARAREFGAGPLVHHHTPDHVVLTG